MPGTTGRTQEQSDAASIRICRFRAGGATFALRLDDVQEVLLMAELSRPPASPDILEGFLNLGGTIIPVIRLAVVLGLPADPLELHTCVLVTGTAASALAFVVAGVDAASTIAPDAVLPVGRADTFNGCVAAEIHAGAGVAHLLDLDRVLLARERQTIDEFRRREDARLRQIGAPSS